MAVSVKLTDNRKDLGRRSEFELGGRSGGWKPASWSLLKKAAEKETGTRRPKVKLVLRASKDNKWLDAGQGFGCDASGALRAAKLLVRKGVATSVWVDVRYSRAFSERGETSHTLFHVEAGSPKAVTKLSEAEQNSRLDAALRGD